MDVEEIGVNVAKGPRVLESLGVEVAKEYALVSMVWNDEKKLQFKSSILSQLAALGN